MAADNLCLDQSPDRSAGKRVQLKKVFFQREEVPFDFIENQSVHSDLPEKGESGPVWARDKEGNAYRMAGSCFIDYGFNPSSDPTKNGSGARAAIAMAEDYQLEIPGVPIPDGDEVFLRFAIGLYEVASAAGGAEFSIRIDGEEVFKEAVAGKTVSDRWRDREIDLSDVAGDRVRIAFAVRFSRAEPKEVEVPPLNPLCAGKEPFTLEVERSVAGFGHPRIMARHSVHRCFTSRKKPNLIIVNIECLHSAYLGCYGSSEDLTPTMDSLAGDGIIYKDFIAASSWTLPSVATLLTGVYPSVHGVTRRDRSFLPNRFPTLPERMQEQGITTAAFITNELLCRESNFDQGFETFVLAPCQNARKVNTLFDNWLASYGDFRFFAYFHYFEPHDPCNAPAGLKDRFVPEPLRGRDPEAHRAAIVRLTDIMRGRSDQSFEEDSAYLKGRYLGEIRYMDRQIGEILKILEARKVKERTVIIITGDHGEEFMEHGYLGHGSQLYDETVRVPLIIWGPPGLIGPHRIVEGAADNASLYATVARLMGIPLEGASNRLVRPALFPVEEAFRGEGRFAFSETDKAIQDLKADRIEIKSLFSVMNWRYKIISDGTHWEFYDLVEDPDERINLAGQGLPEEAGLKKRLESIRKQLGEYGGAHYGFAMDARKWQILQGLGYTGK